MFNVDGSVSVMMSLNWKR